MQEAGVRTRKTVLELAMLLWIVSIMVLPTGTAASPLTITLSNPSDGASQYSSPVSLAVVLTNNTVGVSGLKTEFWVEIPYSSNFANVGNATSQINGSAALMYFPPFAGSYSWSVKVDFNGGSQVSPIWTFTCATVTTTVTQSSTSIWTSTQTVGLVTQYSYLYDTVTQWATAYLTQTSGTTSTAYYYSTVSTTTTGFAKTETTPVTVSQTESATETSYGTISVTQYVYIQTYTKNQSIQNATNGQPSNGTTGIGSLIRFPFTYQQLSQYGLLLSIACMIVVGAYAGFKRLSSRQ